MALHHAYHPHCGCASCSRQELADERADALAAGLHRSGTLFGEALGELTTDHLSLLAGHLADGNDAGAAEVLRGVVAEYVTEAIAERADAVQCTRLEAVQHLLTVYQAAPKPARPMPWRAAA